MIEHSLTSFTTHRVIQNRFLKGTLLNKNGDPFRVYLPSTVQETDKKDAIETVGTNEVVVRNASIPGDLFTVQDLMVASGVTDLERIQNSQSIRHEGTVLVVVINYANRLSAIDDVKYTYQIGYIEGTEAKVPVFLFCFVLLSFLTMNEGMNE
ncbi:hypothetical protein HMI54_012312 [Coelomomyces lativittatus]|nr:hypothetical protein HMI54_012312 [Coelomomyces lativittatus]